MAEQARPQRARSMDKSKSGTRSKCSAAAAAAATSTSTPPPPLVALLVAVVALAFSLAAAPAALAARTHGEVSRLDVPCLTKLNALWATHYPDVNSSSTGGEPVPSLCRSILDQALKGKANDRCPDERAVVECFNEAPAAWSGFVSQCALFLGTATDPAADGTVTTGGAAGGARHLLSGEGEGEGEGEGGGSLVGQGCFPNFKTPRDFDAWLKGDFKETHDYGRASPVALTSAAVFTVLLFLMAAF